MEKISNTLHTYHKLEKSLGLDHDSVENFEILAAKLLRFLPNISLYFISAIAKADYRYFEYFRDYLNNVNIMIGRVVVSRLF